MTTNPIHSHFSMLGKGGGRTKRSPELSAYLADAGRVGAYVTALKMTEEERSERARKASLARWGKA